MSAKYTAGPWFVDRNSLSGYGDNGNTFNIRTAEGRLEGDLIASLPASFRLLDRDSVDDPEYLEEAANAALIAEAPALLASLRKVVHYHSEDLLPEDRDEFRALIARIDGAA